MCLRIEMLICFSLWIWLIFDVNRKTELVPKNACNKIPNLLNPVWVILILHIGLATGNSFLSVHESSAICLLLIDDSPFKCPCPCSSFAFHRSTEVEVKARSKAFNKLISFQFQVPNWFRVLCFLIKTLLTQEDTHDTYSPCLNRQGTNNKGLPSILFF